MSTLKNTSITMTTSMVSSKDNKFRYILKKEWNAKKKSALVISLSAGKANEVFCDYTTMFIINALNELDYGSVSIMNVFSHISDKHVTDAENLKQIKQNIHKDEIDSIIIAWGRGCETANKKVKEEIMKIEEILNEVAEKCLVIADKKGLRGLHPLRAQNEWHLVQWKKVQKKKVEDKGEELKDE